jgi:sugar phosphate isomerase/epimerase
MWEKGEEGCAAVEELLNCLRDCKRFDVPIMVAHTYIGFQNVHNPAGVGLENFLKVVEEAEKLNVKIAFENTEGEIYLAALMEKFKDCRNVGFCWDTGHELCYNKGKNMTALYGDRLICTHLNDNLGISNYDGKIIWTDDLHLLPFDGINNWNSIVDCLNKCGYDDILTFELSKTSMPGRHDNDKYANMNVEEYFAEAYNRACKVAKLKEDKR